MTVTTIDEPKTAVAASDSRPHPRGRLLDTVAVALLATVVSGVAAGRPSLWFDEGATISASASRSLPELWRLLDHIDAVHGLYYLIMHGWFAIFPPTEFWSRVPSCLAVGLAAAGVVAFTKQFSSRTVAVCAGVVFAMLPRVTWAGVEARSYAFTAAAAIWLTMLLVTSIRRNRWWLWVCYAVALMLSLLLNIYLVLLVPAYAVVTPLLCRRRSVVLWWAITSAAAVAGMTPFMLFAHGEKFQVGWISRLNWHNVIDVTQHQFFDNSVPFAVMAAIILLAALTSRLSGRWVSDGDSRRLLMVCVAWIVVPTAISLIYSAVEPFYYPRYLFFTTPAMAVILAVCIVTVVGNTRWIVVVLVVLAAAAFPNYLLSQRQPYAKEGWDYSQVADVITAHAAPGDCLLVDNTVVWLPGPIRALLAARPAAFRPLVDVGRGARGPQRGTLWDGHVAVWLVVGRLYQCRTLWTISTHDTTLPNHQRGESLPPGRVLRRAPAYLTPALVGFRIVERWQLHRTQVIKSVRLIEVARE
jgi:mannosyltransferase